MIYANTVATEMATGSFYDSAGDEYLSPDKLESDYANVRFQRELHLFRSHCPGGSVLDVGCSSGAFLYHPPFPPSILPASESRGRKD